MGPNIYILREVGLIQTPICTASYSECKTICINYPCPQRWGPDFPFWASRSCNSAGWLACLDWFRMSMCHIILLRRNNKMPI